MKTKITFITPKPPVRTPGIRARCAKKSEANEACVKRDGHAGKHSYRRGPAQQAKQDSMRVSTIAKLDCLAMVEDPAYRKKLLADLRARRLRPAVECMLWYYAKGKPKEMVEHSGTLSLQQELSGLTDEELRQRALDVAKMLIPARVN